MVDFDSLKELMVRDRTIRRFKQEAVSVEVLRGLIELTRYCASGANRQPLVYAIATEKPLIDEVYPLLAWAGYYKDWDGPDEDQRPVAYMVQALDTRITTNPLCDEGLHLQAITLGATTLGLGCCIIKSFNRQSIKSVFNLPDYIEPCYVLAIGYPDETAVVVDQRDCKDIVYYRDDKDRQCVPKRPLDDMIININNK